jgi:hypothetical protein
LKRQHDLGLMSPRPMKEHSNFIIMNMASIQCQCLT